jgi:hypothetical protein
VFTHIPRFASPPPFNADSTELCTVLLPGKYLYAVRDYRAATLAPAASIRVLPVPCMGVSAQKTAGGRARSGREPSAAGS